MSIEFEDVNTIRYEWKATVFKGIICLYSDQFTMKGINNNMSFNICLIFGIYNPNKIDVSIKKSNIDLVKATVHLSVPDQCEQVREIDGWKDICYFKDFLTFPGQLNKRQMYDSVAGNSYVYDVNIVCKITLHNYIKDVSPNNFYDELQHFYKSTNFSDITLIVGDTEIPAHRVILSANSPVFATMLLSDMKQSRQNFISIDKIDMEVTLEMLNFFYKGVTKASFDTDFALKMLEASDMYQANKLKNICEMTLLRNMTVENILTIVDIADDYNALELRRNAIRFIVSNSEKVFGLKKFEELFYRKPRLMFELMCTIDIKLRVHVYMFADHSMSYYML
ncbi:TD and POZ domain-containing protein 2-like [Microplitis mediator]|uniref:TD and POZ domain-containing protein 2-like n=1 Tax=Microplitis mediator TaxID=375433 RepID=UPI0025567C19|nr:TD and POZ domain-containing protein 2-like [Microplitis mediator]XP_057320586.1 TD and POZ domain-containing protein 2-like [Microplitis mediator]